VIGKQVKALRRQGKLPAVIYGRSIAPTPITLDLRTTTQTLSRISSSALVTIDLEGEKYTTLVRDRQRNFISGSLMHIDFQAVSMLEKLRTNVSIEVHGEPPAIKNFNGILVVNLDEVEVESLPGDLPERIVLDVSTLNNIGDSLHVKDLVLPENVVVLEDPETIVVVITAPAAEEVEEVVAEVAEEEPEVIEKGKKEEGEEEEAEA